MRPVQDVGEGITYHEDTKTYSRGSGKEAKIRDKDVPVVLAKTKIERESPNASPEEKAQKTEAYLDDYYKKSFVSNQRTEVGDYKPSVEDMAWCAGMLVGVAALPGVLPAAIDAVSPTITGIAAKATTLATKMEIYSLTPTVKGRATGLTIGIVKGLVNGICDVQPGAELPTNGAAQQIGECIGRLLSSIF